MKLLHTLIIVTLVSSLMLDGCSSNKNAAPVGQQKETNAQEPTVTKSQNGYVVINEEGKKDNTSQTNPETKNDEPASTSNDVASNAVSNKEKTAPAINEEFTPANKTEVAFASKLDSSSDKEKTDSGNKSEATPTQAKVSDSKDVSSNIKSSTTKMLSDAQDLKSEINNADDAKLNATANQLEQLWSSFEDNVKPQFPDLYAKVEKYLFPLVASTQQSPIDKKTLAKLNDLLSQALNDLLSKVN